MEFPQLKDPQGITGYVRMNFSEVFHGCVNIAVFVGRTQ